MGRVLSLQLWGCLLAIAGCQNQGADRVLAISASGVLTGQVFFDVNGTRAIDTGDTTLADTRVLVVVAATQDTVERTSTDDAGSFEILALPVGSYHVMLDPRALADSLLLVGIDTGLVDITPNDTISVELAVSYPAARRIEDARSEAPDTKLFVTGIALNARATFNDSTVHLADESGAILATGVLTTGISEGDSVRLLGTLTVRDGEPVLDNVRSFALGRTSIPDPPEVSSATAATADGGRLDARLVSLTGAAITDTTTSGDDVLLTVNDGSGSLEVLLHGDGDFTRAALVPGAVIDARGLLIPRGGGSWRMRPRSSADIDVDVAPVTTADVRRLPLGDKVFVTGVALSAPNLFGDQTIHAADAAGAVRATGITASGIAAGDSIRLSGTVATSLGRRTLSNATVTALGGMLPQDPTTATTASAARAAGGSLDAALVSVTDAGIVDTATSGGDLVVTVDDGSGPLDVVLDADITFDRAPYQPAAVIDATGLLVPTGTGRWRLKPRSEDDLEVTVPVVTIAEARAMPAGEPAVIVGLALNSRSTFGDLSIHLVDATGSIRGTNVGPTVIFVGDSVRFRGTLSVQDGQRTLDMISPFLITHETNLTPPQPTVLTTAQARTASGGTQDAALVQVTAATIASDTSTGSNGDFSFTVDDGSGPLTVILDVDTGISTTPIVPGNTITLIGVLLPIGTGTWQLKPRSNSDLQ